MDVPKNQCILCNFKLNDEGFRATDSGYKITCPRCGRYRMPMLTALTFSDVEGKHLVSGYTREMTQRGETVTITTENLDQIRSQAPQTVLERAERFFRTLARMSKRPGHRIALQPESDYTLIYSETPDEFHFFYEHLRDVGLIGTHGGNMHELSCTLTPHGWNEFQSRNPRNVDSTKAFVAMAFDPTLVSAFEKGIRPAIPATGYRAVRMDYEHFTGDIVVFRPH